MDRFLIAPYTSDSGLVKDIKPWLLPEVAFSTMQNAYVWRGRVKKRPCIELLNDDPLKSRFRVQVGTVASPTNTPANIAIGQSFSVGSEIYTVYQNGAMFTNIAGTSGTAAVGSNTFTINSLESSGTAIYWYPSLPVMGLLTYDTSSTINEKIIGFDTKFAYEYSDGWSRISTEATSGAATWTGTDTNFFWGTTWRGQNAYDRVFFVTNFNKNEPNFMRQYNGTTWNNFSPAINGSEFLISARILVAFKNRLLAFNTWEGVNPAGAQQYGNRVRFSQVGDPRDSNSFRQDIPGRGSALDASTTEQIVAVGVIKDRLIVYFERSTWELVYTQNQIYPFTWQKLNTELGALSTFSEIPFDETALAVGQTGIHSCTGVSVQRVDPKIPDEVWKIATENSGFDRVYGIRDYYNETVYWAYPDNTTDSTYPWPNKILLYNYKNGTWAEFDEHITAFGYYQPVSGTTWDSTQVTWDDPVSWDSGTLQAAFRYVVGGNPQGWTFLFNSDNSFNEPNTYITNLTYVNNPSGSQVTITVVNTSLQEEDFIYINNITSLTVGNNFDELNDRIVEIVSRNANSYVFNVDVQLTGDYAGGGVFSLVPRIIIETKEFNFYSKNGRNAAINKVDFMVTRTDAGEIAVNYYTNTGAADMRLASEQSGMIVGNGTLDTYPYDLLPYEADADLLIHSVYLWAQGQWIALELILTDEQMENVAIAKSPFEMHFMMIYAQPTSANFM